MGDPDESSFWDEDLDEPPYWYGDEITDSDSAARPGGCTGCGCLGPTFAATLAVFSLAVVYTFLKRPQ